MTIIVHPVSLLLPSEWLPHVIISRLRSLARLGIMSVATVARLAQVVMGIGDTVSATTTATTATAICAVVGMMRVAWVLVICGTLRGTLLMVPILLGLLREAIFLLLIYARPLLSLFLLLVLLLLLLLLSFCQLDSVNTKKIFIPAGTAGIEQTPLAVLAVAAAEALVVVAERLVAAASAAVAVVAAFVAPSFAAPLAGPAGLVEPALPASSCQWRFADAFAAPLQDTST